MTHKINQYDVRPFSAMPDAHADQVEHWLKANEQKPDRVRWSLYPIGMVDTWIQRAGKAEAALASHAHSEALDCQQPCNEHETCRNNSDAAAQPTKYDRKQVPELTISDEIRLGMRKLCGHIAECDCQNGIFQAEIEHNDH